MTARPVRSGFDRSAFRESFFELLTDTPSIHGVPKFASGCILLARREGPHIIRQLRTKVMTCGNSGSESHQTGFEGDCGGMGVRVVTGTELSVAMSVRQCILRTDSIMNQNSFFSMTRDFRRNV